MHAADVLAASIEAALREHANPARAEGAKRYLKSELEFIGLPTALFRTLLAAALKAGPALDRASLLALVEKLWSRPVFELRAAAVEVLERRRALLEAADLAVVEALIRESRTWALVDWLATRVAGTLLERFPELLDSLDRWARDPDFWVRRAALLALLLPLRRGAGDFETFARWAEAMLEEREFFIRKALGWVLRETAKKRPALVEAWLTPRLGRASGLTVREAARWLPAERREALLHGHREARARPG